MSNKLQELTDRLYQEGLSKGKSEGEAILAKAKADAADLITKAQVQAEAILAEAQKTADELKSKAQSDIISASEQSLSATKKDIEGLLVNAAVSSKVDAAFENIDFVKEIITIVSSKFSQEAEDINLLLPEKLQNSLEAWVKNELSKSLNKGIQAQFSKKISGGFTIGPKDGSWYLSFTDESFKELIAEYIRPVTRKILFGK